MIQLTTVARLPVDQNWLGLWYVPLLDEPAPTMGKLTAWKTITSDQEQNPFMLAETFKREAPPNAKVYLLIPGKRFDRFGTRHGRGGGWYDRFLSVVPRGWLRVGVIGSGSLSEEPLLRRPWDEPMDWLIEAE